MPDEPATLTNALLGFGLFCISAAIVGGGFKAFGFELGPLTSVRRQVGLFVFGLLLLAISGQRAIVSAWRTVFPYPTIVEKFGPADIPPGQLRSFPLTRMQNGGAVQATIQTIQPGPPGNEVRVYVCSALKPGDCKNEQLGMGRSISDTLPAGANAINIFNFASNPPVSVTFEVEHTK